MEQNKESTPVPLLDLPAQFKTIRAEIQAAINAVLKSQSFILGPEVQAFECEMAEYCHCRAAVGVSSGTDALLIAMMALDVKPGDEVITTPYTFFSTAGGISRLGATPVFVDIDERTFNLSAHQIEEVITERTKAIVPVHLFGQMADMDPIMELATRYQIPVVEDAAQAIGAEYNGRRSGSIGQLSCFSFFPSKNLGAYGDGGMVTTNDPQLADRLRLLRNHGFRPKYHNQVVGGNFRLAALQAAVLRVKLRHLDAWTESRRNHADTYSRLFQEAHLVQALSSTSSADCSQHPITLPHVCKNSIHVYNQFVIRVPCDCRDALADYLQQQQIGCCVYDPIPLHLQNCYRQLGYTAGDFPVSEAAALETLALPIYPELTEAQQISVVNTIEHAVLR